MSTATITAEAPSGASTILTHPWGVYQQVPPSGRPYSAHKRPASTPSRVLVSVHETRADADAEVKRSNNGLASAPNAPAGLIMKRPLPALDPRRHAASYLQSAVNSLESAARDIETALRHVGDDLDVATIRNGTERRHLGPGDIWGAMTLHALLTDAIHNLRAGPRVDRYPAPAPDA